MLSTRNALTMAKLKNSTTQSLLILRKDNTILAAPAIAGTRIAVYGTDDSNLLDTCKGLNSPGVHNQKGRVTAANAMHVTPVYVIAGLTPALWTSSPNSNGRIRIKLALDESPKPRRAASNKVCQGLVSGGGGVADRQKGEQQHIDAVGQQIASGHNAPQHNRRQQQDG